MSVCIIINNGQDPTVGISVSSLLCLRRMSDNTLDDTNTDQALFFLQRLNEFLEILITRGHVTLKNPCHLSRLFFVGHGGGGGLIRCLFCETEQTTNWKAWAKNKYACLRLPDLPCLKVSTPNFFLRESAKKFRRLIFVC